jgi:hypothetical protein
MGAEASVFLLLLVFRSFLRLVLNGASMSPPYVFVHVFVIHPFLATLLLLLLLLLLFTNK